MLTGVVFAALAATAAQALPSRSVASPLSKLELHKRYVDTRFPYTGPAVPVGDWLDQTVQGNGKGYERLYKDPAVLPAPNMSVLDITNNINVISTSFLPNGINIHFQTPYGIGSDPVVRWGYSADALNCNATGTTTSYDRTPPCSMMLATQCSSFFHNVEIPERVLIEPGSTIYYSIPGGNGTRPSDVLTVKTALKPGCEAEFEVLVLNDMGYTNAHGTKEYLRRHAQEGAAFAWHGGDISYADDWYEGILPCEPTWDVCVDGIHTELPGPAPVPAEYLSPLPAGEPANQGGPRGGDIAQVYENNWDLWQNWMNDVSKIIPYQVTPGNHEASCAEFDGPQNQLTALLVNNDTSYNATSPTSNLTYYACPESQRNFTAYNHRFFMNGEKSNGRGNHWYSFDYGLAHFVSFSGETDYYSSPEKPFIAVTKGNTTLPSEAATFATNSGPFGYIENNNYTNNAAYEQIQWLKNDLANVDRSKTPWIFAMSHRPMYSTEVSSYQVAMRNAFQQILLEAGVDAYFAGHVHWYERNYPIMANGQVDHAAVKDDHTYVASQDSLIHFTEGNAGNIESHSTRGPDEPILNTTAVLNEVDFGFASLKIHNRTTATYTFIKGVDGSAGDYVTMIKPSN
ncbi:acid phosphatase AphA [Rhodotorula sp. JG-1b]|nr:acid phosphatase AphA [Rhodotorula sp. JG-1b]